MAVAEKKSFSVNRYLSDCIVFTSVNNLLAKNYCLFDSICFFL